jgi:hypothetical protein
MLSKSDYDCVSVSKEVTNVNIPPPRKKAASATGLNTEKLKGQQRVDDAIFFI